MTRPPTETDVLVVGAGFAGLTAARRLADANVDVVVLEARQRVGGRTHTVQRNGVTIDLGGQWIGPGQDRVAALAHELGVDTYPQYDEGDHVVVRADGPRRVADPALAFDDEELLGYIDLVGALEALSESVPADSPWEAPDAEAMDRQTLAGWVDGRSPAPAVAELFEVGVQAVFAASSTDLSLLHVAHYLACSGGWAALTDTTGGAQETRLVGGVEPLARRLADLLGDRVYTDAEVTALAWGDDGVVATIGRGEGVRRLRARAAVVAVPPSVTQRLHFDPPLPPGRDQLIAHMPGGSVIKFHAVYPTPFWRAEGLSGQVIAPQAVVGATFDGTQPGPDGSAPGPGIITGFFEAAHATAAGRLTQDGRRAQVVAHLTATLGPRAADPIDYVDLDWSAEPHTRGCYGAHLPPGAWTRWGPELRRAVGPIHWAGSECATRWVGYIDGAIESGETSARAVLAALREAESGRTPGSGDTEEVGEHV
ncbi:MAG: FAD-dependent oxidoreductase [Microthrixaceae bacterium]